MTCIAYVPVAEVLRDVGALCNVRESVPVLPIGETWGLLKNGAGTPPVKTRAGWLSFFHGVDALEHAGGTSLYYRAGIVINDRAPRPGGLPLAGTGGVRARADLNDKQNIPPARWDVRLLWGLIPRTSVFPITHG